MKKKKSEPLKYTVSFSDEIPSHDEFVDLFIGLAKLACDAGVEKRLKSKEFKNEEEKIEENEISRKFLSGLEKKLREDKKLKKHIDERIAKRKLEKGFESQ